jgi:hypothetical protein
MPIKDVEIKNISVGDVTKFIRNVVNAENVREENVECRKLALEHDRSL